MATLQRKLLQRKTAALGKNILFGWLFLGRRWWGRRRFLRGLGLGLRFHLLFLVFLYLLLVDFPVVGVEWQNE